MKKGIKRVKDNKKYQPTYYRGYIAICVATFVWAVICCVLAATRPEKTTEYITLAVIAILYIGLIAMLCNLAKKGKRLGLDDKDLFKEDCIMSVLLLILGMIMIAALETQFKMFFVLGGIFIVASFVKYLYGVIKAQRFVDILFEAGSWLFVIIGAIFFINILPNERLQDMIVTVFAALVSGMLTLTGVIVTIKYNNFSGKGSTCPLFTYNKIFNIEEYERAKRSCRAEFVCDDKENGCDLITEIQNSERSAITLTKIILINGLVAKQADICGNRVLLPGSSVALKFNYEFGSLIYLQVADETGNMYYYLIVPDALHKHELEGRKFISVSEMAIAEANVIKFIMEKLNELDRKTI